MRRLLWAVAAALVVAWSLGPFVWQILTSVRADADLGRLPPLLPPRIDPSHYRNAIEETAFLRAIGNSLGVASLTTVLAIGAGCLAAFALIQLRFRRRRAFLLLLLSISMFPPVTTVSPLYLLIRALGLRDTWGALVWPYTGLTLPLSVWILASFFRQIPHELYEAARLDGCTPLQAMRRVILPLAAPGVFSAAILVFIFAWNEFLFALSFTATSRSVTVPVAIARFTGLYEVPWGDIAAASVIVTLPLVALVLAFQRRIVAGLTGGAVKG